MIAQEQYLGKVYMPITEFLFPLVLPEADSIDLGHAILMLQITLTCQSHHFNIH